MSRPFPAQYEGWCYICGERVRAGQMIRYERDPADDESGVVVHDVCPSERPVEICPRCHLTRPCEHED